MDTEKILEEIHKLESQAEMTQETLDEIKEKLADLWIRLGE